MLEQDVTPENFDKWWQEEMDKPPPGLTREQWKNRCELMNELAELLKKRDAPKKNAWTN